jgi:hypothetical protein
MKYHELALEWVFTDFATSYIQLLDLGFFELRLVSEVLRLPPDSFFLYEFWFCWK